MEVREPVLSGVDAKAQMKMEPSVSWSPDLNAGGANARGCTVWGKTNLTDRVWRSPTNDPSRFFKITVEMPQCDA